jgi:dTDP-4-amino-4,6-dideoxygalactose transaminase
MVKANREVAAIEEFFSRRYGREALYLPSGRLGLYLAFREWLPSRARVLMSPLQDDVVFFTVLAAGLRPVFGPLNAATGNLDPEAIDEGTWSSLAAVLTTNLYGVPDRMDVLDQQCRRHGLVLLEDAAHGFDSSFGGRRIGTFGKAAVFSLSKHLEIPGGVLVFPDSDRRKSLVLRAKQEVRRRPSLELALERSMTLAKAMMGRRRAPRSLARLVEAVLPRTSRGGAHRMPFTDDEVRRAQAQGGGLDSFEAWVRMDHPAYRTPPIPLVLRDSLSRLERFEENRRRRLEGGERLLGLGYTPRDIEIPRDTALLRVPLFVEDRERVIAYLARRGLTTEYIYDPPLDLYAPTWSEGLASPPAARAWSRDVLPVNPLAAERFVSIYRDAPQVFRATHEAEETGPSAARSVPEAGSSSRASP